VSRLFFALWPEAQAAQQLAAQVAPVLAGLGVDILAALDMHVTLCFLGSLDQTQQARIVQRASDLAAAGFELGLDTLEYWRAAHALVLSTAGVPDSARELAARLRALAHDCGCVPDQTPWQPHLTLARRVAPAVAQRLRWPVRPDRGPVLRLAAQQFWLVHSPSVPADAPALAGAERSGAPRYRPVQAWPLRLPTA
jgi:2'-5' RNA ligase